MGTTGGVHIKLLEVKIFDVLRDVQVQRHFPIMFSLIKSEDQDFEDDQIPS